MGICGDKMLDTKISDFVELLETNGIPIHGVSGTGVNCRIDFKDEATNGQKTQARDLATSFDWRRKRKRLPSQILADYLNLTNQQRTELLNKVIAQVLYENPKLATNLATEIDPT